MNKDIYLKTVKPVCLLSSIVFPVFGGIVFPVFGGIGLQVAIFTSLIYGWIGTTLLNYHVFSDSEKKYLDNKYSFWRLERYKFIKYESKDETFNELQYRAKDMMKYMVKSFFFVGGCWFLSGMSSVLSETF